MVYEERYIGQYNIPPLQVVGWEGIFGFVSLGLLLIPVSQENQNRTLQRDSHRFSFS